MAEEHLENQVQMPLPSPDKIDKDDIGEIEILDEKEQQRRFQEVMRERRNNILSLAFRQTS